MANQERIEALVSEAAYASLDKLEQSLVGLNDTFVKSILLAEKYANAVAKSGALKELTASQKKYEDQLLKSALAEEKIAQASLKTQLAQEKVNAVKAKAEADAAAREQKEIARDNARIVREAKKGKTIISNSQLEIDAYNNSVSGNKKITSVLNATDVAQAASANSASSLSDAQEGVADSSKKMTVSTLRITPAAVAAQRSIASLRIQLEAYQAIADNATDPIIREDFNRRVQDTSEEISRLSNVGRRGFDEFGNSVSRSGGALTKMWQGIKTVAALLPGVGIAGLLAFAAEPIIEYVKNLDVFKKSLSDVAKMTAFDDSDYKKALSDVSRLKVAVSEFNSGIITGTELVNVYNEGIGETAGKLSTVTEVEEFYNSKAPAYVQAMFLRAKANALLELSTDKVREAQKRATDPSVIDLASGFFSQFSSLLKGDYSGGDFLSKAVAGTVKSQKQGVIDLQNSSKAIFKLYEEAQKEYDAFSKKNGFSFDNPKGETKLNTDAFDLQKQRLEQAKQLFKETADDEKKSLDDRINALRDFNETVRAILTLEANNELSKKEVSSKKRIAIQEKLNFDLLEADKTYANESEKLFESQLSKEQKERLRANQSELTAINNEEALKLDVLNKAFINGTISEKQHGELKLDIQREYFVKYINAEIKQVEDLIALSSTSVDQRAEYEEKLAKLKLKASEEAAKGIIDDGKTVTKSEEENAKRREEIEKHLADKKKQLQQEVFDLGVAIVNGAFDNEKNKVQKDIDLLETQKQIDIENVNNTVATEEEKADKIAIIEAKALANKEVLEQKQRHIDQRKARFQKAISVAEVAVNTAKDVAKISTGAAALSIIPVVGPALAAAALSQIPFAIGIGAAQIAAILATPIPSYFTGTDNSKAGYAMTDELGPELYIPRSGKPFIGGDKPNIKNLQAGTKIIPHHELVRMTAKPELSPALGGHTFDTSAIINSQESTGKKIIKALSSQKSNNTIITKSGWRSTQSKMNGIDKYLKRNFN